MTSPEPNYKDSRLLTRVFKAAKNSMAGLRDAFRNEGSFRLDVYLALTFAPLALWLPDLWSEKAVLLVVTMLVPIVELLNSAVEYTVDRISMERNELSRIAKDIGSAAVFLTLCTAGLVWTLFLVDRYLS